MVASELVSIFGHWTSAPTRVLFGGIPETPIFATSNQVNVTTPAALAGRVSTDVQLEFPGGRTAAVTIAVTAADPALFTTDGTGRGRAAMWAQQDGVVAFFGTGFGPGAVSVEIGGRTAEVLFAGPAPGLVRGVTQINVRIPPGTLSGAPIVIKSGARVSAQRPYL